MLICALLSSTYYQFLTLSNQLLVNRFNHTETEAKNVVTIYIFESIITTPIFGSIIDRVGRKPLFLVISSLLAAGSFFALFFFPYKKTLWIHLPIFGFSQFFALFNTTIWPTMMVSVPSRSVAICLGIGTLLESSLMSLLPIFYGFILQDGTIESYQLALVGFCAITVFSFVICVFLYKYDDKNGKLLARLEDDPMVEKLRRRMAKKGDLLKKVIGEGEEGEEEEDEEGDEEGEEEESSDEISTVSTMSGISMDRFQASLRKFSNKLKKNARNRQRLASEGIEPEDKGANLNEKLEEKVDQIVEELDFSVIHENEGS